MQYILSQEEYDELRAKQKHEIQLSKSKLQKLCTKIANEMPIKYWSNTEAQPWGCKLNKDDDYNEWYCDECPVQDICPAPKSYSK